MQILQLILSIVIALCAMGMFIGAVVTEQSVHIFPLILLFLMCVFAVKMVRIVFQEFQAENE